VRVTFLWLLCIVGLLCAGIGADESPTHSSPGSGAADSAKAFLKHLDQGQIDEALKLWDSKAVDAKLKTRLEKMAAKVKKFGGIEKVDVGTVEDRKIKAWEKQTGEKIDIVPIEISCQDRNLLLASFSIRKKDGEFKIFILESLKEWGGTASLDDELPYMN
jgi:hypothetical protein